MRLSYLTLTLLCFLTLTLNMSKFFDRVLLSVAVDLILFHKLIFLLTLTPVTLAQSINVVFHHWNIHKRYLLVTTYMKTRDYTLFYIYFCPQLFTNVLLFFLVLQAGRQRPLRTDTKVRLYIFYSFAFPLTPSLALFPSASSSMRHAVYLQASGKTLTTSEGI